jgi:hypothetical protein
MPDAKEITFKKVKGGSSKFAEKLVKIAEEIEDLVEEELKDFFTETPDIQ